MVPGPIRRLVPGPLVMHGCTQGLGRLHLRSLPSQVPHLLLWSRYLMRVVLGPVHHLVPGSVPRPLVMCSCTRGLSRLHLLSFFPWVLCLLLWHRLHHGRHSRRPSGFLLLFFFTAVTESLFVAVEAQVACSNAASSLTVVLSPVESRSP